MKCPRDSTELTVEKHQGIEVDRGATCNGRWLDPTELDDLEATAEKDESLRRATIEYSKRESELNCPVCAKRMRAFNYRAYDLEMETCVDGHGYWLDAGEEGRVRDIILDRVRGLERAATAEASWGQFLNKLRKKK
jgi:Zn-finger nucleic acid-binding protein